MVWDSLWGQDVTRLQAGNLVRLQGDRTVVILLLKSGLNANACALLLTFFLPRDRVCLYKKKLLSGQTSPST